MKEDPILFSAPIVRALLNGSKTQTRHVLKQATGPSLSVGMEDEPGVAELPWLSGDGPGYDVHETAKKVPCPNGAASDRLWMRESWRTFNVHGHVPPHEFAGSKVTYDADTGRTAPSLVVEFRRVAA
jgi:hypothetical protein